MNIKWPWKKRQTLEIVNHATFGTDLLNALGLGHVKNVTYIKVEAFPPGQFPIVTIKCHPTENAFDVIERFYEVHDRTITAPNDAADWRVFDKTLTPRNTVDNTVNKN